MHKFLASIFFLCYTTLGLCQSWPVLLNPRITSCDDRLGYGPCTTNVKYTSDGVQFIDVATVSTPDPSADLRVIAYGMHCSHGNLLTGVPFSGCQWRRPTGRHMPLVSGKCQLINSSSWQLTPDSTCAVVTAFWDTHDGAGPGGECVIFSQSVAVPYGTTALLTPMGVLDATTVANSGNRFCQKALPPDVQCDIVLPDLIDHGTIQPSSHNTAVINGTVDCGTRPNLSVLGGADLTLGAGVTTRISTDIKDGGIVYVTSSLRTTDAAPGEYRATFVLRVSPY